MRVTLLYFAVLRDLVGRSEEALTLPPEVRTIAELRAHLERTVPALAQRMSHVRIAKNEAFAADTEALAEGDVIALIPPVAGGS